jgi:8-oxo-dGTP pyrophosphatase MutT (NUDIX family)
MSIVPAKPSASVLLLRDHDGPPEVLLVRRNAKITFHGGAWVFPGGKVDPVDEGSEDLDELGIARRAAIREVFEETGVHVAPETLQVYSHWTTPDHMPKRFATWFFVAVVAADTVVRIDESEIVDFRWVSVEQALHQRASEEIELPAPAFVSLTKLREFGDAAAILSHLSGRPIDRFVPRIVKLDDGRCALYQEDAGYDALDLQASGARHRLMMETAGWFYIKD